MSVLSDITMVGALLSPQRLRKVTHSGTLIGIARTG